MEAELNETSEGTRKSQLSMQIAGLRDELSKLQGPEYAELLSENRRLKSHIRDLQKRIDSICESSEGKVCKAATADAKEHVLRARLYELLLEKYAKTISENENKTVGEIKSLISETDLSVQSLVENFKPENYSFANNYLTSASAAFNFITREIDYVDLDLELNFWLSPKEILTHKVGDDEDLAVLLCSMLYALDDSNAEVVIAELENLSTHAFVITKYNGKFVLLDPTQKKPFDSFMGRKEDVLHNYSFRGSGIKRFLYRFNHEKYEQFI
jgi:hypothetical protein